MKRISFPLTGTLAALVSIAAALPTSSSAAIYSSDLSITFGDGTTQIMLFQGAKNRTAGALVTTLSDESGNPFTGSGPFPADMKPTAALSIFENATSVDIGATWKLGIRDENQPGEGDDLVAWSIFGKRRGSTGGLIDFEYFGTAALDVDNATPRLLSIVVTDTGQIADINVRVVFGTMAAPEPGSLALLGFGLAGLGAIRRRSVN